MSRTSLLLIALPGFFGLVLPVAADGAAGSVKSTIHQPPQYYVDSPSSGTITQVKPESAKHLHTLRVVSAGKNEKPWAVQIVDRNIVPIKKGESLQLTYLVKTVSTEAGNGESYFRVSVDDTTLEGAPSKLFQQGVSTKKGGWKEYRHSFRAKRDMAAGELRVLAHFAFRKQELKVAGFTLNSHGDTPLADLPKVALSYDGRDPAAPWRAGAEERIRKHRMADLTVSVVSADGKPVEGAKVAVAMRRHAFPFGSSVNLDLIGAEKGQFPVWSPEKRFDWGDAKRYRELVFENFTKVTPEGALRPAQLRSTTGWQALEKHQNFYRRKNRFREAALGAFRERGIAVRGHYLSWGALESTEQRAHMGSAEQHHRYQMDTIRWIASQVGGEAVEWDTLNHPCGWGTSLADLHGGYGIHAEIMETARSEMPAGVRHATNEGNVLPNGSRRDDYAEIIQYLIDHGQAPDTIGFMAHFTDTTLTAIPECYEVIGRFAAMGPSVSLLELDVDAGEDERLQADYLRDIMTIAFSHPAIEQIILWGFWEKSHWKPDAALWREDWSPKPAAEEWLDLVKKQWWTEHEASTGADGKISHRGFLGDYTATVTLPDGSVQQQDFSLGRDGAEIRVALSDR